MTPHTISSDPALAGVPTDLFIGGAWRPAGSGRRLPVDDPATGVVIAEVADAGIDDGRAACAAAAGAQRDWASTAPRRRGELLRAAYEAVMGRREDLARLMTLEMGKAVAESRAEVEYAADFIRWFSEEAVRVAGGYGLAPNGRGRLLVTHEPVGPCLLVTPWNFPLAMATRKIAPALAAGCTVVVKPARQTPLCTLALASILESCGLPPGVLNVITTSSSGTVVAELLDDARLRKLSFTGSTEVGRGLMAAAAPRLLRLSMELGGNAPFIVLADADLDAAVEGAMIAKLRNIGQACTAANRFVVDGRVYDEFAEGLAARMRTLRLGPGLDPATDLGPLIDSAARDKVLGLVGTAARNGARLVTGGGAPDGPGWFVQPTVLADVPRASQIASEEVFGPVASLIRVDGDAEALSVANDTDYGLAAYVYTRDLDRAFRLVEGLEVGMIGVNQGIVSNAAAPFGGIKQSGFGREGGTEGIHEYLSTKYAAIAVSSPV